jgi:quaternary ammonium compound-resistance protein SugE
MDIFTIGRFFEICFTISLKYSQGFTKLVPSIITVIFIVMSFLLSPIDEDHPIGNRLCRWAGIGAAGTVVTGIIFFGDSHHIVRCSPSC